MKCSHEKVRIYKEVSFEGDMVDGKIVYDPADVRHDEIVEIYCVQCDENLNHIEAIEKETT
jgi:hypothetical protein